MNISGGHLGVILAMLVGVPVASLAMGAQGIEAIISGTILLLLAFCWLAWETQWLTIRLHLAGSSTNLGIRPPYRVEQGLKTGISTFQDYAIYPLTRSIKRFKILKHGKRGGTQR